MTTRPPYQTAADALGAWRDSILTGTAPVLFPVGTGALGRIELGPGRVMLLGGLPGGGKTALAMQCTFDALRASPDLRAVVANVEMSAAVLLDRQLSRLSGVPLDAIAHRRLDGSHADRIDAGLATLDSIADRLAFVTQPHDLGCIADAVDGFAAGAPTLLVLDYVQRIRPPGQHGDKRGSVDALMNYLRQFADVGCAVLVVSAVARSKDKVGRSSYAGDSLSLASFRESSELEYGADSAYVLVPDERDAESVNLRCLKHRHGEPLDIPLTFDRARQSFTPCDAAPPKPDRKAIHAKLAAIWNKVPTADDNGGDE